MPGNAALTMTSDACFSTLFSLIKLGYLPITSIFPMALWSDWESAGHASEL